jgi:hypothetical protein
MKFTELLRKLTRIRNMDKKQLYQNLLTILTNLNQFYIWLNNLLLLNIWKRVQSKISGIWFLTLLSSPVIVLVINSLLMYFIALLFFGGDQSFTGKWLFNIATGNLLIFLINVLVDWKTRLTRMIEK